MPTKKVIQRNLPLDTKYMIVKVNHVERITYCKNCGRQISNSVTVKNSFDGVYAIGLDCLETLLLNNDLLTDGSREEYLDSILPAIKKAKSFRNKMLREIKKDPTFEAKLLINIDKKHFGFAYSHVSKNPKIKWRLSSRPDKDVSFNLKYRDLTFAYVKDLPFVKI